MRFCITLQLFCYTFIVIIYKSHIFVYKFLIALIIGNTLVGFVGLRTLWFVFSQIQIITFIYYRVIHKSVEHFKNSQQIDFAMDHGNSYADRETLQVFFKEKPAHIVAMICR
jgi:hypothetical protein